MTVPEPSDVIPDFLCEQFVDLSAETLRGVGSYARKDTYVAPEGMPDSMKVSFALQDDDTLAAIADYADELAAFLEEHDADSRRAVTSSPSDEEEKWGHKKILEWHGGA